MPVAEAVFDNVTARGSLPSQELSTTYLRALERQQPRDLIKIAQVISSDRGKVPSQREQHRADLASVWGIHAATIYLAS